MNCGGAEKVLLTIFKHIDKSKFNASLALVKYEGSLLNELPKETGVIDFNSSRTRYIFLKFLKLVWSKKPDIVFSTLGHLNLLIILLRSFSPPKVKFMCRETNIPSLVHKKKPSYKLYSFLYRTFYNYYDSIICQSEDMKNDLVDTFDVFKSKISIINNPCNISEINRKMVTADNKNIIFKGKYNLLSVGSLTYQKGFDLLLTAIKELKQDRFHLTIIGDGPERNNLKELAKTLNISHIVDFIGFKDNPYSYMYQADLFILSSRYEGFPNVVLESMACGTPVVAFDSPGDISKIIINGSNGYLVEYLNTNDLTKVILSASKKNFDSHSISSSIKNRFSIEEIMPQYEKIFTS